MLRRLTTASRAAQQQPLALVATRRAAFTTPVLCNLTGHLSGLASPATYTSLATLPYSPFGTAALVLLAYNVGVVGLKHLWYALEMVSKDYHQDQQLQVVTRYLLLFSLLFTVESLFIEA